MSSLHLNLRGELGCALGTLHVGNQFLLPLNGEWEWDSHLVFGGEIKREIDNLVIEVGEG